MDEQSPSTRACAAVWPSHWPAHHQRDRKPSCQPAVPIPPRAFRGISPSSPRRRVRCPVLDLPCLVPVLVRPLVPDLAVMAGQKDKRMTNATAAATSMVHQLVMPAATAYASLWTIHIWRCGFAPIGTIGTTRLAPIDCRVPMRVLEGLAVTIYAIWYQHGHEHEQHRAQVER